MANETIEQITSISTLIERLERAVGTITQGLDKLTQSSADAANKGLKGVGDAAKGAGGAIEKAGKSAEEISRIFGDLGKASDKIWESLNDVAASNVDFVKTGAQAVFMLKTLTTEGEKSVSSLASLGSEFKAVSGSTSGFVDGLGSVIKSIPIIGEKAAEMHKNFMTTVEGIKSFENRLISAAQSGGNFYNIMGKGNESFVGGMDETMGVIVSNSAKSANLLGINFQESLTRTVMVLETLPGEFNKIYDDVMVGNKAFSLKTEQILSMAARGTGKSYKEAMDIATSVVAKFGEDTVQAAQRLSVLNMVSKETQIPFKSLNEMVQGIDNSFKMYGDQMKGVVDILGDVSTAMQGTNLGFEGQIEVVKSLSSAISNMALPMRAFIGLSSQMSSPGGMIGVGLNVERMLQEGKMGEVVGMMQETIKKRSGRGAVSLEEATDDPGAQRAFMVQRQMLSTMGIQDTGTANRILEVMSKAELGGGTVDAEKALAAALGEGDKLAARQTDVMALAADNFAQATKALQGISDFYKTAREETGTEGPSLLAEGKTGNTAALGEQGRDSKGGVDFSRKSKEFDVKLNAIEAGFNSFVSGLEATSQHTSIAADLVIGANETLGNLLKDSTNPAMRVLGEGLNIVNKEINDYMKNNSRLTELAETLRNSNMTGAGSPALPISGGTEPQSLSSIPSTERRSLADLSAESTASSVQNSRVSFEPVNITIQVTNNGENVGGTAFEVAARLINAERDTGTRGV
jgi:ABC-type transporter Mla subunit MlaD